MIEPVSTFAYDSLASIRKRLLDLSSRNALLNYKFPKGKSLEFVHISPNQVFEMMNHGKAIDLLAVPTPTDTQLKEYLNIHKNSEVVTKEQMPSAMQWAKYLGITTQPNKSRKQNNLIIHKPILGADGQNKWFGSLEKAHDFIHKNNISHLYKVVQTDEKRFEIRTKFNEVVENTVDSKFIEENKLQTLLYPKDLDAKLKTIKQYAESSISETGSNILYIAIGFLEWKESEDSDQKRQAPLFTVPIKIERKQKKNGGYYEYQIEISDEGLISNVTLQEKLQNDFGLSLPVLDEKSDPEDYFKLVEENIIQNEKGWCINRQVCMVLLNFTKQAMYQDLDPKVWSSERAIENHPVIQKLFHKQGVENESYYFISEYNLDQLNQVHENFPIIYDADSSQHSALIDAVNGENLVIEGPPGSGKSQTITNLIAAAMNNGKKVLFVAEKMAALNVVKDRLDKAGLGNFCLELHSHKSNKLKILQDLTQQYNLFNTYQKPKNIDVLIKNLDVYKNQLNNYVSEINSQWKETNLTVHEILSRAAYYRNLLDLRPDQVEIKALDVNKITPEVLTHYFDHARLLENAYHQIKSQCHNQQLESHFWYGVNKENLLDYEKVKIVEVLTKWTESLVYILNTFNVYVEKSHNTTEISLSFLENLAEKLKKLPPYDQDVIYSNISNILQNIEIFKDTIQKYQQIHEKYQQISTCFSQKYIQNPLSRQDLQQHQQLIERGVHPDLSVEALSQAITDLNQIKIDLTEINQNLVFIKQHVPFDIQELFQCDIKSLKEVQTFTILIKQLPTTLWKERSECFDLLEVDDFVEEFESIYPQFHQSYEEAKNTFKLENLPDTEILQLNYKNLCIGGFFKYFTRRWWGARKFISSLAKNKAIEFSELQGKFNLLIDYQINKNLADKINKKYNVMTPYYQGVETPIDKIKTLRQWYKSIRHEYGMGFGERVKIGQSILKLDYQLAQSIIEVFDKKLKDHIPSVLLKVERFSAEFNHNIPNIQEISDLLNEKSRLSQILDSLENTQQQLQQFVIDRHMTLGHIVESEEKLTQNEQQIEVFEQLKQRYETILTGWCFDTRYMAFDKTQLEQAQATLDVAIALDSSGPLIKEKFTSLSTAQQYLELLDFTQALAQGLWQEQEIKSTFFDIANVDAAWEIFVSDHLEKLIQRNEQALKNEDWLFTWSNYIGIKNRILTLGLDLIVEQLEQENIKPEETVAYIHLALYYGIARDIINSNHLIQKMNGIELSSSVQNFRQYDLDLLKLQRQQIAVNASKVKVEQGISQGRVAELTEYSLIAYEANKKIRHVPIRSLLERSSKSIQALKPCFMMSPMSVAQYLKPGLFDFDLVVMDEASQILPEDAIGALARGKSAIIVGDPKQLPPTSFFSTSINSDDQDDEEIVTVEEAESILESVISIFKTRRLRWHYRSRHESLIAFSNKQFYQSDLVLFPSPMQKSTELGIRFKKVEGIFDTGRNHLEAFAVVDEVCRLLRKNSHESIGIVAMNSQQRDEIEAQLELRLSKEIDLQELYEQQNKTFEPIFIKNLENVQGDERDVIVISMTYGPSQIGGKVYQRFGPINQHAGWRRLNVLFTRSKKRMHIISSMSSTDILVSSSSSKGVTALKDFLRYCETGFLHEERVTGKAPDSDFEIAVMNALEKYGYQCEPQLGVAGFFLDIAVRNPNHSGQFLLGIECDGATYHSAKSSRDRDRLRQQILEGLGWEIHRIWSTDWFKNSEEQIKIVVDKLEKLKAKFPQFAVSGSIEVTATPTFEPIQANDIEMISTAVQADQFVEPPSHIEVGDLVRYYDCRHPEKLINVTISENLNRFVDGITHKNSPLAQALLGLEQGDTVAYTLPSGEVEIEIYEIVKN